jgi:pimeloyl-ACP methyl ester carboxylesterase
MVTDLDRVRTWLALESWVFWGIPAVAGARAVVRTNWQVIAGVGSILLGPEQEATLVLPEGVPDSARMRRAQAAFLKFDSRSWLSSLRIQALVLAGMQDPVAPVTHSKALHERLSGSSFVAIKGANHNPAVQGHEAAVESIRHFLRGL